MPTRSHPPDAPAVTSAPGPSQAPNGVDVHLVAEEVRGPVLGVFIAAYTVFTSRGYFAYAKVTWTDPPSYWDARDVQFKIALGPRSTATEAHEGVFEAAGKRLARRYAFQPTRPGEE